MTLPAQENPALEYVPPWNESAENATLGSILIDNRALENVRPLLHQEDFYQSSNARIWAAMTSLADDQKPIDMVTLQNHLLRQGILEEVGGICKLIGLCESTPTAVNAEYHARIVQQNAELRSMLQLFQTAAGECYRRDDPQEIAAHVMGALSDRTRRMSGSSYSHIAEGVYEFLERVSVGPTQTGKMIQTGIRDFDGIFGGLPKGLVTLSGRTGEGKTTVAEWIALGVAQTGVPVLFVTMEVPRDTLIERFVSMHGRIKSSVLRHGPEEALDLERDHIQDVAERLMRLPLWVMDHSEPSLALIKSVARAVERREGRTPMVVIDRLELLETMNQDEVVNTTRKVRAVKKLQMELGTTVLLLCQLNQDGKRRPDPKPRLSDLLGSGAIKNDSQMVIMLYRPSFDGDKSPLAYLYVRKNNYGPTGKITVLFEPEYPRFSVVVN